MIHTMETLHRTGRVVAEGDCLIWRGALAGKGYPVVADDRERYVHRLVLLLAGHPVPKGKQAAHRCGRSNCIALAHIYPATQSDNERDKIRHGTDRRGVPGVTHCGKYLKIGRCSRAPHDGPCKPDIFVASYDEVAE